MIGVTTQAQFTEVEQHPGVVLLDFYKQDCGPCQLMAPTVRAIDTTMSDVFVATVDVDVLPLVAAKYGVTGFPTFVILKGGQIKNVIVGRVPGEKLRKALLEAAK